MKTIELPFPIYFTICLVATFAGPRAHGADPTEDDYYPIVEIPIPEDVYLEVGALEWMPDGKLAVSSRRGEIYMVENALSKPPTDVRFKKFAEGLHQVFGLAERDGALYATQRPELTRVIDTDSNGEADLFETVSDGWGLIGRNYEWAWGSKFDKEGNIWIILTLDESYSSNSEYRGWCLRVNEDGTTTPTASGIRSPGGIGFNAVGDVFYVDNQGEWNGTNGLKWLRPGSFQGNPSGNKWYSLTDTIGPRPKGPGKRKPYDDRGEKNPGT